MSLGKAITWNDLQKLKGVRYDERRDLRAPLEDLEVAGEDYVRGAMGDVDGAGLVVPVAGRAAEVLQMWLAAAGIVTGAMFRAVDRWDHVADRAITGEAVRLIVKRRAEAARLDPREISAHSIRGGFITAAGQAGVSLPDVMANAGLRYPAVAMGYYRANPAPDNPPARLLDP